MNLCNRLMKNQATKILLLSMLKESRNSNFINGRLEDDVDILDVFIQERIGIKNNHQLPARTGGRSLSVNIGSTRPLPRNEVGEFLFAFRFFSFALYVREATNKCRTNFTARYRAAHFFLRRFGCTIARHHAASYPSIRFRARTSRSKYKYRSQGFPY